MRPEIVSEAGPSARCRHVQFGEIDQLGAQERSMPVNSGSRPGAPLGGHITQAGPLLEDPVGVAAPAVDALAPRVAPPVAVPPATPDPPETVLLLPPVLPPVVPAVPEVEAAPVPPPAVPVVELVEADPGAPVATVEVVVPVAGVEVAVPGVGVASVVDEFCMVGNAATPPPAGNPLRSVALPTPPPVGAAVCASAGETRPIDRRKANPELRIMAE
jgi:hypothetical protein